MTRPLRPSTATTVPNSAPASGASFSSLSRTQDSVLASYISITTFRDPTGTPSDRYFVRAMDYTGNRSATTQVFTAASGGG